MNLKEQAAVIAAAIEGKPLKIRQRGLTKWYEFKPHPDTTFDFKGFEYAIEEPEPLVLHQYIIKDAAGGFCLSHRLYRTSEEAGLIWPHAEVVGPAPWTRIEVPE